VPSPPPSNLTIVQPTPSVNDQNRSLHQDEEDRSRISIFDYDFSNILVYTTSPVSPNAYEFPEHYSQLTAHFAYNAAKEGWLARLPDDPVRNAVWIGLTTWTWDEQYQYVVLHPAAEAHIRDELRRRALYEQQVRGEQAGNAAAPDRGLVTPTTITPQWMRQQVQARRGDNGNSHDVGGTQ